MRQSRRSFLSATLSVTAAAALGQGITPHRGATLPRGKRSGIPYGAAFVDTARGAGIANPVWYGSSESKKYVVESVGCGCAFLDYDNDGWIDILVLGGSSFSTPEPGITNRLYRNNRDGTFRDVTLEAGLTKKGWACGVCVGDYNNDGFDDIFLSYWGQNVLYRNNGNGTFSDVTRDAGLLNVANRYGAGCTFLDYNRDGNLDLFVSNYAVVEEGKTPLPGDKPYCYFMNMPVNCGPRGLPFGRHSLYRNNGNGTFTDVSEASGISKARNNYGLTVVAADFDDDGWQDIYVACDSSPALLFMNQHDGTFSEEGAIRGVAYSNDGQEQAGMGVAVGDYDGDGRLDILKTNFAEDLPVLYRNLGGASFEDATRASGLAVDNRFVCWGTGLEDFDNDGWQDIAIATGHVYPELERRYPDAPYKSPLLLYRNLGQGHFEELFDEAGSAILKPHSSRGVAFGDFDNDGDIDMLVVNLGEPPSLFRNDVASKNHWIKIRAEGTVSNRSGIGARIEVAAGGRKQVKEVLSQSSFVSCNDFRQHFGLGNAAVADITIRWPDGKRQTIAGLQADRLYTIKETVGIVANRGWK
ncbi:CRTAC1 family protein [Silvibacterium acidisoli]|uniref:CRTAC1 family protein n=1 Tax=Acidobacteriaceae bacterium ZG23-2 TaxID=2883246 RepID=UPI00406D3A56